MKAPYCAGVVGFILFCKITNHLQELVLVKCLTGLEISFVHPRGITFKKYKSQDLAPVIKFNHCTLSCIQAHNFQP